MIGGRTAARFTSLPNGSIRVRHREFVTNIDTTADDQNMVALPINPGDSTTFPWLSLMASNYDRWEPVRISISYEPFTATTTSGTVSAFIDYDPNDEAPTNKAALLNSMGAKRAPIWGNFNVDMARSEIMQDKHLFTRVPARLAYTGNLRLSDAGTVFVAVTDSTFVGDVGEIWVDYEIILHVPAFHKADPNASRRLITNANETQPLGTTDTSISDEGSAVVYTTAYEPTAGYGTLVKFAQDFVGRLDFDMAATDLGAQAPEVAFNSVNNGESNGFPLFGDMTYVVDGLTKDAYVSTEIVAKAGDAFNMDPIEEFPSVWSGANVLMKCLPYAKVLMGALLAVVTTQEQFVAAIKISRRPALKRLTKAQLLGAADVLHTIPTGHFTIGAISTAVAASTHKDALLAANFDLTRLVRMCNAIRY
jgi:hypothetical protein